MNVTWTYHHALRKIQRHKLGASGLIAVPELARCPREDRIHHPGKGRSTTSSHLPSSPSVRVVGVVGLPSAETLRKVRTIPTKGFVISNMYFSFASFCLSLFLSHLYTI